VLTIQLGDDLRVTGSARGALTREKPGRV